MPIERGQSALERIRAEIEAHLAALDHPIAVEDDVELFDLTAAHWRLTLERGKLLLEMWNPARSVVRRVEEIAYRDGPRLGLFVRRPAGRESVTLELRGLGRTVRPARTAGRAQFLKQFLTALAKEFPGWKLERTSHQSDREYSLSSRFARGVARRGTSAWAFLALSEDEGPEAGDAALAFALVWLDWLRARAQRETVSGLKLFLPAPAVELNATRARALNRRTLQLELYARREPDGGYEPVAADSPPDLQARLVPRRQGESLLERHRERLLELLGDCREAVTIAPDSSETFLSLRVRGLEIARLEGDLAPRLLFGLEGSVRELKEGGEEEFRRFVARAIEHRRADCKDSSDEFYRLQPERWLESILLGGLARLDPELSPQTVYPQVPTVTQTDRGVIDILGVTRAGRLAVVELKLKEEINLPLQALDYWLRVKDLNERQQFEPFGYFPGVALAPAPPLLYLVSPAFRFHSTTHRLLRYLDPSIEIRQIGLNDRWRRGVKVLFRREGRAAS